MFLKVLSKCFPGSGAGGLGIARERLAGRPGGHAAMNMSVCIYEKYIYIHMYMYLAVSLSLYIYIYRERDVIIYIYIYIYHNHIKYVYRSWTRGWLGRTRGSCCRPGSPSATWGNVILL